MNTAKITSLNKKSFSPFSLSKNEGNSSQSNFVDNLKNLLNETEKTVSSDVNQDIENNARNNGNFSSMLTQISEAETNLQTIVAIVNSAVSALNDVLKMQV